MGRRGMGYWAAGILLAAGAVFILVVRGEQITLQAKGSLPVVRDPLRPSSGDNVVSVLAPGEKAEVVTCKDLKSYFVIRVRTRVGAVGYVNYGDGHYMLERRSITARTLFFESQRITFACTDMFTDPAISRFLP